MKSDSVRRRAALLLVGLLLASPLPAANPRVTEPTKPPVEVRIIPVGDAPKLVMRYVNGIYTQMPYKPGEAPPSLVRIDDDKHPITFPLDLNRPTTLPGAVSAAGKLSFSLPPEGDAAPRPWGACKIAEKCTKALVIVAPSAQGDWLKPNFVVDDISPPRLHDAVLRILNLTNQTLEGEVGALTFTLKPGAATNIHGTRLTGEHAPFRLSLALPDGTREAQYESAVPVPHDRADFYFIRPTAKLPGKRITVCTFSEPLKPPAAAVTAAAKPGR